MKYREFPCRAAMGALMLAGACITYLVPQGDASGWNGGDDSRDRDAKVISHLELNLNNFRDALLREKGGRCFLYIQKVGSNQITIIDVSRRKKPKVVGAATLGASTTVTKADFEGDVAIVPGSGKTAAITKAPSSEIFIWDYSKPGSPQLVKKFTGVEKVISGSDNIVYVLDTNGLTIVQVFDQQMRDWDYDTSHLGP